MYILHEFRENFAKNNPLEVYNLDIINKAQYQYVKAKVDATVENFIGTEKTIKVEKTRLFEFFSKEFNKKLDENVQFDYKVEQAFILAVSKEYRNQKLAEDMFRRFINIFGSDKTLDEVVVVLDEFSDIIESY